MSNQPPRPPSDDDASNPLGADGETDGQATGATFIAGSELRDFWDMSPEEQHEFVRDLLGAFSPNPDVRKRAADSQRQRGQR